MTDSLRTCINCSERVPADALQCPRRPSSEDFEMCSYCEQAIHGAPLECPHCGKDLSVPRDYMLFGMRYAGLSDSERRLVLRAYPDDQREDFLTFWDECEEDMHYMAAMANVDFLPSAKLE